MSSFAGPPDEIVRVTWINEFRDHSQGLVGATRRASQEYRRAAAEQRKTDAISIKSAKQAAREAVRAQEERREALIRFRELGLSEDRIQSGITKRIEQRARAEETLARRTETAERKILDATRKTDEAIEDARAKSRRERNALVREHENLVRETSDRIRAIELENSRRIVEIERKAATAKNKIQKRLEEDLLKIKEQHARIERRFRAKEDKADIDRTLKQARLAIRKGSATELAALRKELRKRTDAKERVLKEDVITRRRALNAEIDALKAAHADEVRIIESGLDAHREAARKRIEIIDEEVADRRTKLKELAELQERFDEVSGIVLGRGMAGRRIQAAEFELDRDLLISERLFNQLHANIQLVRKEAERTGQVSEESFNRMNNAAHLAGISGRELGEEMRSAGIGVRNFANEKQREIVFLRDNTREMGRHRRQTRLATQALGTLSGILRFTTNEMIIFNQTVRIMRIPFFVSLVELAIRALNTLVGGIAALVSALGPLAGQLVAIGPLALGAAQAFTVWKIATDSLGKSSNDLGKIIETSLTGSAEDFQKLMEELPRQARVLATEIRGLSPGFRAFREQVSARIFSGLTEGLRAALPTVRALREEFITTASIIGRGFARFGQMVGSAEWAVDLQQQAENTNAWLVRLGPAAANVAVAVKNLALSAAPLVDHLVTLVNRFGDWFRNLAEAGRRSGDLSNFWRESNFVLDQTLKILGRFGKALLNIGRIAYNIIGRQLLRDLARSADAFRRWTESTRGQNKIRKYFMDIRGPLYEMGRLIRDLVKAFFLVGQQKDFEHTLETLRTRTLPAIVTLLVNMQKTFTPAFINLIENLVELFTTLTGEAGPLTTMVKAFAAIIRVINDAVDSVPLLSKLLQLILGGIIIFRTLRFTAAITGIGLASRGVAALVGWLLKASGEATRLNAVLARLNLTQRALPASVPVVGPSGAPSRSVVGPLTIPQRTGQLAARHAQGIAFGAGTAAAIGGVALGGAAGNILSLAGTGALVGAAFPAPIVGSLIGAGTGAALGVALELLTKNAKSASDALKGMSDTIISRFRGARRREREAREAIPDARIAVRQARLDVGSARDRLRALRRQGADTRTLAQATLDYDAAVRRLQANLKELAKLQRIVSSSQKQQEGIFKSQTTALLRSTRGIRDQFIYLSRSVGRGREAAQVTKQWVGMLDQQIEAFKKLKPELADRLQRLKEFTQALGDIPDVKTIKLILQTEVLGPPAPVSPGDPGLRGLWPFLPTRPKTTGGGGGGQGGGGDGDGGGRRTPAPIDIQRQILLFQESISRLALNPLLAIRRDLEAQADRLRARIRAGAGDRVREQLGLVEDKLSELDAAIEERLGRITEAVARTIAAIDRRFERAGIRLQIRGIEEESPGGAQFILSELIRQRSALQEQAARLIRLRQKLRGKGVPERIKELTDEINNVLDRLFGLAGLIAQQRRQVAAARFERRFNIADLRLQKLELQQQLAGTFDTGGAARAALINEKIIPILREREAQLKKQGPKKTEELLALQIQILQFQLEAQEAIKQNTEQVARNTGNLSFEFNGQRFTDMVSLGIGV